MPNRYDAADRRTGKLIRQHEAEFQNLRLRFPLDHLNVVLLKRYAKAMYKRMDKRNRETYLAIAMAAYAGMSQAAAEKLVDRVLSAYDPVTGYVYDREVGRKRDRLVESMAAAQSRSALREANGRANRLWMAQVKQFADEIVDGAVLDSYRDAGVHRVRWVTIPDEQRCAHCAKLNDREFSIDSIPAKPHPKCRCYVVPVA